SVMMQCFAICSMVTVLWTVYGYSLAFDTTGMEAGKLAFNSIVGGLSKAFLAGVTVDSLVAAIPESVFFTFQLTFAIITPALIVGAFAERMKFSALLVFMALWFTVCYAPMTHMVWSGDGALMWDWGVLDFAGGTVVHINAGIAGLVAALVLGKRKGFGTVHMAPHNLGYTLVGASMLWVGWFGFNAGSAVSAGGSAGMAMLVTQVATATAALVCALVLGRRRGFPDTAMPPHNMTMAVTGAAMLWVGWFGFNAGSALAADGAAGMAMIVTHIGAATGAFAWMVCEWLRYGKPSALGIVTGMVAGLGTITPASGFVGPIGALIIGAAAGVACFFATNYMKRALNVDDSLDVFPVHGVGGLLGTLLTGILVSSAFGGIGYPEKVTMGEQFVTQLVGVVAVGLWSGVLTWVILKLVNAVAGMRVAGDEETEGLDTVLHNEKGYNL
ncbi:MAG TPA: ammonium transporter, partial [Burkholderiales bacterium]|nr:ammonium transporter [Burkholderiales bacterium]